MEERIFGNRYKITERIGMGGMAEVFKAIDSTLGRTVALKIMLPQYASDKTFAARFRQEAQAAANLSSPYIVNIYDWGQDHDSYYIVMEHVRGTDLKSALEERGAIHQRKVAEIGAQICQGLSVAHSYGIIHRDIKSANIMVQTDGNIKVMDFGIAQASDTGMTKDSSVLGTAHYVSPEQAQGKKLTPASDLYSLGIVLYEAVTGQLPFNGPDAVSVALKQVNDLPTPVHVLKPDIDPDLEAIIARALSKDVEGRYQTAAEMKNDLEAYLAGAAVSSAAKTAVIGTPAAAYDAPKTAVMPSVGGRNNGRTVSATASNRPVSKKKNGTGKKVAIIIASILAIAAIVLGVMYAAGVFAEKVPVPNVIGMTEDEAKTSIEKAKFKVGTVTHEASSDVEKGMVCRSNPGANEMAEQGSTVDIAISDGPASAEQVSVPNLNGLTKSKAVSILESAGLVASVTEDYGDSDSSKGTVIKQSPSSGTKVTKGSTITITISKGKKQEYVDVPSVVGMTESAATNTLSSLGFQVNVTTQESSETKGNVISQSPSGGSAKKGSTVTIIVSSGTTPTPTPTPTPENISQQLSTYIIKKFFSS